MGGVHDIVSGGGSPLVAATGTGGNGRGYNPQGNNLANQDLWQWLGSMPLASGSKMAESQRGWMSYAGGPAPAAQHSQAQSQMQTPGGQATPTSQAASQGAGLGGGPTTGDTAQGNARGLSTMMYVGGQQGASNPRRRTALLGSSNLRGLLGV